MTPLHEPVSDGTRRHAFSMFREAGIADHHDLLPWAGIESLSRDSGVTEGRVLQLIAWVKDGCPRVTYDHMGPDVHRYVRFLEDGDIEFETMTDEEHHAMASPPRSGRVRMPPAAPAPVPEPVVVDVVAPEATPAVSVTTPSRGSRPVGRIRMPPIVKAAAPESEAVPIVVEAEAVTALPNLRGSDYVQPCLREGWPWQPSTPARPAIWVPGGGRPRPAVDTGPEPYGPPCPYRLHPMSDLRMFGL